MASVQDTSPVMSAPAPAPVPASLPGPASPITPLSPTDFELAQQQQESAEAQQQQAQQTATTHKHRLSHSASKLPAFRFADLKTLKKDSLVLPSRLQNVPPSPVSPAEQQQVSTGIDLPADNTTTDTTTDAAQDMDNKTEPISPVSVSAAAVSAVLVTDPRPARADPPAGAAGAASTAGSGGGGSSSSSSGAEAPGSFPFSSLSLAPPSLSAPSLPGPSPSARPALPATAPAPSPSFQNPALQSQQEQVPGHQDTPVQVQDTQVTQVTTHAQHHQSSLHSSSFPSSPSTPSTAIAITNAITASSLSPPQSPAHILNSIEPEFTYSQPTPCIATTTTSSSPPSAPSSPSSPASPHLSSLASRPKTTTKSKPNYASLFHDSPPRVVISAASSFSSPASAPPASPLQSPLSPRFPASPRSPSPRSPSPSASSPPSPCLQRTLTYPSPTRKRAVSIHRRAPASFSANRPDSALASSRPRSNSRSPSPSLPPVRPSSGLSTKEWARGQRDLILTKANKSHTVHTPSTSETTPEAATPSRPQHHQHQSQQSQDSQQSQQSQQSQSTLSTESDSHPLPSQPLPDDRRKTASRPPVSFRRPRNDGGSTSRNSSIGSVGSSSSPTTATSATSASVSIPPIRSFRSSGSRKSLGLDSATIMSLRSPGVGAAFDDADTVDGGGVLDPRQRDHTLRALEGRSSDDQHGLVHTQVHSQVHTPRRAGTHYYSHSASHAHSHSHSQSATRSADPDTTADIFMRIARDDDPALASQRRPFSAAVPTRQNSSPPQITRRLSDQRDTVRQRRYADDQVVRQPASTVSASTRDAAPRVVPGERTTPLRSSTLPHRPEPIRTRTVVNATRPSPTTPRTSVFYDTASEVGTSYSRRRPSVDASSGNQPLPLRASSIKTAHNFSRTYNSSPLAPRHADTQRQESTDNGNSSGGAAISTPVTANGTGNTAGTGAVLEGTESSASTAAPSTVWDELDDLKSRMRRLELTGKIPPTAGAAMSRVSDDRPRTATTSATNISGSPKRTNNNAGSQVGDHRSTTSSSLRQQQQQRQQPQHQQNQSQQQQQNQQQHFDQQSQIMQSPMQLQRDAHQSTQSQPILLSAMNKVRPHISDDIFSAIEAAATEALSLSQMVGVVGQPGPISSGASSIGTGMPSTVTDRQLRRKAESICRSLTELCLALNDDAAQRKVKATTAATVAAAHANVSAAQSPATHAPAPPPHQSQYQQSQQQAQQAQQIQQQQQQQQQQEYAQTSSSSQPATTSAPSSQHPLQHPPTHSHSHSQPQQSLQIQTHQLSRDDAGPISPTTTTRAFTSLASSRRAAAALEQPAPKVQQSPRALTRQEDRRASFLTTPTLPMPRYALAPPVSSENVGRRSSLMINRTRRAASEEPEDQFVQNSAAAGRRSSLLRTRRAATEEPEEMPGAGRKTSLLVRTRRAAVLSTEDAEDEDQDHRAAAVRSPSRAVMEVAALRTAREYHRHQPREYLPREYASTRDYVAREYPSQVLQTSRTAPLLSSMTNGNASTTTVLTIPSNVSTVGAPTHDNNTYTPSSPTAASPNTSSNANHPLASSALPRRRMVPSSLNSRLVTPQTTTTTATTMTAAAGSTSSPLVTSRRFLERSTPERSSGDRDARDSRDSRDVGASLAAADRYVEERLQERLHERVQRQLSMGQAASSLLGRTASVSQPTARRNMSSAASQLGGYR